MSDTLVHDTFADLFEKSSLNHDVNAGFPCRNTTQLQRHDAGGFGDCGYRAIIVALLAAHLSNQLTDEQYNAPGLEQVLRAVEISPVASSTQDKLSAIAAAYQAKGRGVLIQLASALRKTAVETFYTAPFFDGFRAINIKHLSSSPDHDLTYEQSKKKNTYISATEIAAAAKVLALPIQVNSEKELKHPEVYNPTSSQQIPLILELKNAHYVALIAPKSLATPNAFAKQVSFFSPHAACNINLSRELTLAEARNASMDTIYRQQRKNLEFILAQYASYEDLQTIFATYPSDDYLVGKNLSAATPENNHHIMALAAWKNPAIARALYEMLVEKNPAVLQALQQECLPQTILQAISVNRSTLISR